MNTRYKKTKRNNWRVPLWSIILAFIVLLLVAGGIYFFLIRQDTQPITSGVIKASSPTASKSSSSANNQSSAAIDSTASTNSTSSAASTKALAGSSTAPSDGSLDSPPTGTFVSDHSPNLDGSPHPSSEESACNTAPGASCYIQFTKNGIVKTLPTKTADSNGSVIWDWDVKLAGFTTGNWQINAVASLNGQTQTATDNMPLVVTP